ncbi:hypothetical protein ACTXQV_72315, partial [Klebsiella pneumoniae]
MPALKKQRIDLRLTDDDKSIIEDLSSPGLVEVRCRRRNEQGSNNARDSMYWQALLLLRCAVLLVAPGGFSTLLLLRR